ncbi:MAG: immunoglobulin domain-containing protein, partial [Limisphaerales bacterium]
MSISGNCLGSYTLAPGLTVTYNGGNTASVTGKPTGSIGTVAITATVTDGSGCSGGLSDTRSTSLIIQNSGGGPVEPSIVVSPQSTVAQVGSDVVLSGGASGNPAPVYFWNQGITAIPGATNNTLVIPSAQLTNAGVYSLIASNSQGKVSAACILTMAVTPGSNSLSQQYTNYPVAGQPVTMDSLITNVPTGVDTYSWYYNNNPIGVTSSNFSLTAAQATPSKSGVYAVTFNSTVGGNTVVNDQQYISYWAFGFPPALAGQPTNQTLSLGSNATFAFTVTGGTYASIFLYLNQTVVAETNLASYNPVTG